MPQSRSTAKFRDFQNRFLQPKPLGIFSHVSDLGVLYLSYQELVSDFWHIQKCPNRPPGGNRGKWREFLTCILRLLFFLNIFVWNKCLILNLRKKLNRLVYHLTYFDSKKFSLIFLPEVPLRDFFEKNFFFVKLYHIIPVSIQFLMEIKNRTFISYENVFKKIKP
jgi:hypothetical protein